MTSFNKQRDKYLINSEAIKYIPALKRPIISLKEYDHLLDSDLELNLLKKTPTYCTNMHKLEKQMTSLLKLLKNREEEKQKASSLKEVNFRLNFVFIYKIFCFKQQ